MSSQKLNERMVGEYIENLSKEDAIIAIAKAITCRDEKISKSKGTLNDEGRI
jgi:hypothetical protein